MKILWLASWYPSEQSPLNGDFIQRHAKAAALFNDVYVIYVEKDKTGKLTKSVKEVFSRHGKLSELVVYYFVNKAWAVFSKLASNYAYRRCYKKAIKDYIHEFGKPDLVHVHVAMKAGIAAVWVKSAYNIPFVVTEHWTGYLPEAKPSILNKPVFFRAATKKIFRNAIGVSAVSKYLAKHLRRFGKQEPVVIPNVVDTEKFVHTKELIADPYRFVHISGLDYQKDPETLFSAFAIASEKQKNIRLDVFGPFNERIVEMVKSSGLENHVFLHGEVAQAILAENLRTANALVLPSRFETFGCVIIEANACGVPVIVSDIPVLHEIVQEGLNGNFVKPGDAAQLAETILAYCHNTQGFDREKIAASASSAFSYQQIGAKFDNWYRAVIKM
jgi:glycosyltransferase involved in cell wall biosynthesis